ncbi:hypothetical protein PR003_g380 [Phytophthora rubi]|uniref:Uncharacterized protein n=2 Tax=Phytophthora TaxID=4783 RepID=A0A6A3P4L2_9STRA|nr:hypothetical protein PR002_g305 [Phytophthora rubi]KAE9052676.1 hypothetical protein PR001_g281 [Phytophthora rubi]KAE9360173.1 hypothetical protein PR003_g380 [Phytophthora rubi]KAE9361620.1 hypothetical protein PF008_g868 [Phytophthora fragariae]
MSLWLLVPHDMTLILCVPPHLGAGSTFWEIAGGGGPRFGKYPTVNLCSCTMKGLSDVWFTQT